MTKEEQKIYNKQYHSKPENKERSRVKRVEYCKINTEKMKLYWKNRYKANRESIASASLEKLYGITQNEYNKMFNEQEGKCHTCKIHQNKLKHSLAVDHCHISKRVRGLLCHKCNTALGLAKDNIDILNNLIKYLSNERE